MLLRFALAIGLLATVAWSQPAAAKDMSITLTPKSAEPGALVGITGTGPDYSDSCAVTINDVPVEGATCALTEGQISGEFDVPLGQPPGEVMVQVCGAVCDSVDPTWRVSTTLAVLAPIITLSPKSAEPGGKVEITGNGPVYSEPCFVLIDNVTDPDAQCALTDGHISGAFIIPLDHPSGQIIVLVCSAKCDEQHGPWNAPATLVVLAPTITLSPKSAEPGGKVEITGNGPIYSEQCLVLIDNVTDPDAQCALIDGHISGAFIIPLDHPPGQINVLVCSAKCDEQHGPWNAPGTLEILAPTITLSPKSAEPGEKVKISGNGPIYSEQCLVLIDNVTDPDAQCALIDGHISGAFVVPPGHRAGTLTVTACSAQCDKRRTPWSATATMQVVARQTSTPASSTTTQAPITVPTVVGMRRDSAVALLNGLGLRLEGDAADEAVIRSQNPAAGSLVALGTTVNVEFDAPVISETWFDSHRWVLVLVLVAIVAIAAAADAVNRARVRRSPAKHDPRLWVTVKTDRGATRAAINGPAAPTITVNVRREHGITGRNGDVQPPQSHQ